MDLIFNKYRHLTILLAGLFCYIFLLTSTGSFTIYHLLFIALVASLYFAHNQTRFFFMLIIPFILQNTGFDLLRYVPFSYLQPIHVVEPYVAELSLFGVNLGGKLITLNVFFETHKFLIADYLSSFLYTISDFMIPIMSIYFWKKYSANFSGRFQVAFLVMNIFAFLTYVYYPAAAPWYPAQYGLFEPSSPVIGNAAGLADVDKLLGMTWFVDSYSLNPVVFGAIPSMHAGFPAIIFFYTTITKNKPLIIASSLYLILMCFSAVYLGHHYVIDLLIGIIYAFAGFMITERLLHRQVNAFYKFAFNLFFRRGPQPIFPLGTKEPLIGELEGFASK